MFVRKAVNGISLVILLPGICLGSSRLTLEIGHSFLRANNAALVLVGIMVPAEPLAREPPYYEFNLGGWNGREAARWWGSLAGLNGAPRAPTRSSPRASLISNTSDMFASTFEFYWQFLAGLDYRGSDISVFHRHWCDAASSS